MTNNHLVWRFLRTVSSESQSSAHSYPKLSGLQTWLSFASILVQAISHATRWILRPQRSVAFYVKTLTWADSSPVNENQTFNCCRIMSRWSVTDTGTFDSGRFLTFLANLPTSDFLPFSKSGVDWLSTNSDENEISRQSRGQISFHDRSKAGPRGVMTQRFGMTRQLILDH